jgi:SAM-dependent methyltransferase
VAFPVRLFVKPGRLKAIDTDAQTLALQLRRLWRADFWGPIPPRLLARYGITYRTGPAADFTRLSYADESFDVVSCISVLEHMPPGAQLAGVREMARVLKPGGRLIITYDKIVDLTSNIIETSRLRARAIVEFRPAGTYEKKPDVVGICLIK